MLLLPMCVCVLFMCPIQLKLLLWLRFLCLCVCACVVSEYVNSLWSDGSIVGGGGREGGSELLFVFYC